MRGENQGVGDLKVFIRVLKERLIDCRWQKWSEHVNESERFNMYVRFCGSSRSIPKYLEIGLDKHFIYIMTKFRLASQLFLPIVTDTRIIMKIILYVPFVKLLKNVKFILCYAVHC